MGAPALAADGESTLEPLADGRQTGRPLSIVHIELPFAPGTSPFRAKGVLYLGMFEYLDKHLPGGRKAALAGMEGEAVARFFAQPFLASGWYDSFPGVPLQHAAARIANQPVADFVRQVARWQAERDTHGVYRFLLKLASAEMVVDRVPLLATRYFDYVKVDQQRVGPKEYTAVITGVPAPLAALYMGITEPFLEVAIETAGARDIRFRWSAPEPDGARAGVGLVRLRRHLCWA